MKKPSLKTRIYAYLRKYPNEWINGERLEELAMEAGYKASNSSRRARELAESGQIERKVDKSVYYRYVPSRYEIYHQNFQQSLYASR